MDAYFICDDIILFFCMKLHQHKIVLNNCFVVVVVVVVVFLRKIQGFTQNFEEDDVSEELGNL